MSSSRRSSDFLNSPSTFKAMYNSSRKTDFAKLKLICSNALEKMSAHHLLDVNPFFLTLRCKSLARHRYLQEAF